MTGVPSNAAVATLTVAQAILDKDLTLALIIKLASPLQLKVVVEKKGCNFCLTIGPDCAIQATQRCAILRALCGVALDYALDQSPYYLLGGYASRVRSSTKAAAAMGSLAAWMSAAESLQSKNGNADEIVAGLATHLDTHAFLIPSSTPTLADYDMAAALLATQTVVEGSVARWLRTVYASMVAAGVKVPLYAGPIPASPLPVFYTGTEDMAALLQPKKAAPAKPPVAKPQAPGKPTKADKKQQQQKQGAEKKPAAASEPAPEEYNVAALDIRVGKITKAWHHEGSDKLFCETVDVGEAEPRAIASGLRAFYQTEDLENRLVLVLCNLKARKIGGFASHGMVLCASNADHTAVEFVVPPEGSQVGERVAFDGFTGSAEPENKVAKKKIFEKLAPDLQTNEAGEVVWKGAVAKTPAGVVKALNGMPKAHVS